MRYSVREWPANLSAAQLQGRLNQVCAEGSWRLHTMVASEDGYHNLLVFEKMEPQGGDIPLFDTE